MRKIIALIITALILSGTSYAEDYDPQHTMSALNMAIVSINRIITTESLAVLEAEYSNIINNLSIGNIESDKDMTELYRDMMSIISRKRVREGDSSRLRSYYDAAEQRRIAYALTSIKLTEEQILATEHDISGLDRETQAKIRAGLNNIAGISRENQAQIKAGQNALNDVRTDINRIRSAQDGVKASWLMNMAVSCVSLFKGNVFAVNNMLWDSAEAYADNKSLAERRENAERSYRQIQGEQEVLRARGEHQRQQAEDELEIVRTHQARLRQQIQDRLSQQKVMLSRLKEEMKQDENMLKQELQNSLWKMQRQDIADCNELQERLLQSSWNLLRKYKLPDEYRLTQRSLNIFYRAVNEQDISRRSRMLRNIEDEFKAYPPYWYYRAETAREAGNFQDAHKFYDEFRKVWRPVLRRDPYMIEAAKFRIQEIISEGRPIDESRAEILEQLEIIYANTPKDDWPDNLFMGVAFFLLGEQSRGMDCIAVNIDFEYETKTSGILLSQMEKGRLDSAEVQEIIRRMNLQELFTAMNISDTDTAMVMALFFEGSNDAPAPLAGKSTNPVIFHALRLAEQSRKNGQDYAKVIGYVKRFEGLQDKINDSYSMIEPLVKKYADEGRENAEIFFADMLMYGWGVQQDTKKAEEIYSRLAQNGNIYAQFVVVQNRIVPVVQVRKEETPTQKTLTPAEIENLYKTGRKYYYGQGVPEDNKKAHEYLLQAANAGHTEAMYLLGTMYRYGYGVNRDLQEARKWYQKAASRGDKTARIALDNLNKNGR